MPGSAGEYQPIGPGSGGGGLTVGSTTVASGTSGYALTDNAGVLGDTPIRTILTANQNYYVATTGSDSNDGSLAHPWATLQHAQNFISENIDFGGFTVTVNTGAGRFGGCNLTGTVGGGIFQFAGAGVASTSLFFNGMNPTGTAAVFSIGTLMTSLVALDQVSVDINPITDGASTGIFIPAICTFELGNATSFTGNVNFTNTDGHGIPGACLFFSSPCQAFFNTGDFVVNCTSLGNWLQCNDGSILVDFSNSWTLLGTPTITDSFVHMDNGSAFAPFVKFTGSATGTRFSLTNGCVVNNQTGSPIGNNFFPGSTAGIIDQSSFYDQVSGSNDNYQTPLTGFTITMNNNDTDLIIDPAGTLAAGTVKMAASPIDGQKVSIRTSQIITSLTINGNGATVAGYTTGSLALGGVLNATYKASNTTWYF